jgi:phosphoribosylformimino-5-aminoimidazole carboxamide ribotide isomerase
MRQFSLIPAVDLKRGLAVRGVAGQRDRYQPLNSPLVQNGDFSSLMLSLENTGKFHVCYLADLDAIERKSEVNIPLISAYHKREGSMRLMVDAGIATCEEGRFLLDQGIEQVIVGTETLPGLDELEKMLQAIGSQRLLLSVDVHDETVLSPNADLAKLEAPELIRQVVLLGIEEIILLQLSRVGTGSGLDKTMILNCLDALSDSCPDAVLYVGGGIASEDDLRWLEQTGANGAIVSRILHQGLIV